VDQEPGTVQLSPKERLFGWLLILAIAGTSVAFAFGPQCSREVERKQLAQEGVDARATILALKDTGNTFNDQPEVAVTLTVRPADREAFRAEVIQVMGVGDIQRYQPGVEVTVKYDPNDLERVSIINVIPAEPNAPVPKPELPEQ
jgi:hypothetical protein